jgi:hypothetical protein
VIVAGREVEEGVGEGGWVEEVGEEAVFKLQN